MIKKIDATLPASSQKPSPAVLAEPNNNADGDLVKKVKSIISEMFLQEDFLKDQRFINQNHAVGKMLRTALVQRLCCADMDSFDMEAIAYSCAAIELVHAATLFHDDVIDGGEIRRGEPTLWRQTTTSGSILIGDLFLCHAISFLTKKGSAKLIGLFLDKMRETCAAEIRQELVLRGKPLPEKDCFLLARGKSGPLFAFGAALCSKGDLQLEAALEEAGYCIGTAYQLADDLLDELGDTRKSKKTLGTDRLRKKYTLAYSNDCNLGYIKGLIESLCFSSLNLLKPWTRLQAGLRLYLENDFYPVIYDQCNVLVQAEKS